MAKPLECKPPNEEMCLYMASSEWFSRGWTLQELLAPQVVVFCSSRWSVFGHISVVSLGSSHGPNLAYEVRRVTGIPSEILVHAKSVHDMSIAQRMSWAANRATTRTEDQAYCLLGLFGVNMPLLYGEGRKAFLRLQEEMFRRSTDLSLLALVDKSIHRYWQAWYPCGFSSTVRKGQLQNRTMSHVSYPLHSHEQWT